MKTWAHLLVSSVLAAVLYPLFGWDVLLIPAGGVLIDVDHYFWYIYKYKSFNLVKSYRFYVKNIKANDFNNVIGILLIFHTIEFFLIMVLLSFYLKIAFIFTIGLISHYLLDLIFLYSVPKRFITNHSIIWWLVKNSKRES